MRLYIFLHSLYCTRESVIGVEDINLLPSVSVDVTGCHSDGVALSVSQGVERGGPVVNGDVDEPLTLLVILEHQVWAVVAVNRHQWQDVVCSLHKSVSKDFYSMNHSLPFIFYKSCVLTNESA